MDLYHDHLAMRCKELTDAWAGAILAFEGVATVFRDSLFPRNPGSARVALAASPEILEKIISPADPGHMSQVPCEQRTAGP
jgi:hypothetical protein